MQVGWRYLFFCLFCFCSQVIPLHPCIYKRKTNYYFLIIIFLRNSSEQHTEVVGLLFQSKGEPASRKLIGSKFSFELFKTLTYLWNLFKFYHLFGKQKWSSQLWSNSCKETPRKNVRLQCDLNPFIWLLFAVLYNFCIFSHFHHYLAVRWKQPLIYSFSSNMFNINFLWITWALQVILNVCLCFSRWQLQSHSSTAWSWHWSGNCWYWWEYVFVELHVSVCQNLACVHPSTPQERDVLSPILYLKVEELMSHGLKV